MSSVALPNLIVNYGTSPLVHFIKNHPNAEEPFKEKQSEVSLSLTVIGRTENRTEDVVGEVSLFETGLQCIVPAGTYLEILAAPNLYKAGYMLAHGTHIIQPEDRGNILVPLYKYKDGPDLDLPFRAAVLLPRAAHYVKSAMTVPPRPQAPTGGLYGNEVVHHEVVMAPVSQTGRKPTQQQNIGKPVKGGNNRFL